MGDKTSFAETVFYYVFLLCLTSNNKMETNTEVMRAEVIDIYKSAVGYYSMVQIKLLIETRTTLELYVAQLW